MPDGSARKSDEPCRAQHLRHIRDQSQDAALRDGAWVRRKRESPLHRGTRCAGICRHRKVALLRMVSMASALRIRRLSPLGGLSTQAYRLAGRTIQVVTAAIPAGQSDLCCLRQPCANCVVARLNAAHAVATGG
ncbi:MAG: hypothetical protein RL385_1578 [Pseudomonadota bacterium]